MAKSLRSRTVLSLGELLTMGTDMGYPEAFMQFVEKSLKVFGNDMAQAAKNYATRMGAKDSGALIDSIYGRAITFGASGDAKVGIRFLTYGIYVNLGVGRGVTNIERSTGRALTSERASKGLSTRKARPFLDNVEQEYHEKLSQLISGELSEFMSTIMARELSETIRIEL